MKILFFGYWGANEGLSQATINPHLELLTTMKTVEQVIYVTIERTPEKQYHIPNHPKIEHCPYISFQGIRLVSKASDFTLLPLYLIRLIRREKIDLLMCRSALAGGIGYWAHRVTQVPFTVESFEPHADYMAELAIWSKSGISYRLQKHLEEKQKKHALHLMPVTHAHKNKLVEEGVPEGKISVMPCAVDLDRFAYSESDRGTVRRQLGIPNTATVGIYVGKFGDIYWDEEAFALFKSAFTYFEEFYLLLLSPHTKAFVEQRCEEFEIPKSKVHHSLVLHAEVPQYLSAADFAFSLHKPSSFSYAFSPIKNGEYWANGLPIVSPQRIGDDSEIIRNENAGVVTEDTGSVNWLTLNHLIVPNRATHIVELSKKYRNLSCIEIAYQTFITPNVD
ncbi:glycosyltransferase [Reichenbachiella agariperforans]|uniref:glycosyltransferase n=1 Tax=Reichenbachiella agariperforans TaxID=156994 RepID=UPI001C0824AE|nr:glycosyltransferase [Reichenbachiella agariperforans]MBU2915195.1 glycosyltransferase [Reichenbachiella agariperforans]